MAKKAKTAEPTITRELTPEQATCPHCGHAARADYANRRTVHTLAGVMRLNLTIRRCHRPACVAYKKPYRPEAEGSVALPRHEFGLDVIALVGRLRYTGGEWDDALGLQYGRARMYDPTSGRWYAEDPMGFDAGDVNLNRYVGNAATTGSDPSGMKDRLRFGDDGKTLLQDVKRGTLNWKSDETIVIGNKEVINGVEYIRRGSHLVRFALVEQENDSSGGSYTNDHWDQFFRDNHDNRADWQSERLTKPRDPMKPSKPGEAPKRKVPTLPDDERHFIVRMTPEQMKEMGFGWKDVDFYAKRGSSYNVPKDAPMQQHYDAMLQAIGLQGNVTNKDYRIEEFELQNDKGKPALGPRGNPIQVFRVVHNQSDQAIAYGWKLDPNDGFLGFRVFGSMESMAKEVKLLTDLLVAGASFGLTFATAPRKVYNQYKNTLGNFKPGPTANGQGLSKQAPRAPVSEMPATTLKNAPKTEGKYKDESFGMIKGMKAEDATKGVKYFAAEEAEAFRITTDAEGRLTYAQSGKLVNTKRGIYIMDEHGNIYVHPDPKDGVIHHSSLSAGGKVAAAGDLHADNGVINKLNDSTGHYFKTQLKKGGALERVANELKEQGAKFDSNVVQSFYE